MNHKSWVTRQHPVLTEVLPQTPFSVGNGSFVFTADISGFQSLAHDYASVTPLCTMSDWGWHSFPAPVTSGHYSLDDVRMDTYPFAGRTVTYARTRFPGNEPVYDWLRQNPHKVNLARIGLRLNGTDLSPADFSEIHQQLHLYSGMMESEYRLCGIPCHVRTLCDPERDILAFHLESVLLLDGLTVDLDFPYGSPEISGANWAAEEKHRTFLNGNRIFRIMDNLAYSIRVLAPNADIIQVANHRIRIVSHADVLSLTLTFIKDNPPQEIINAGESLPDNPFPGIAARCTAWWASFWETGGMLDLSQAADFRAAELERRIVLSLYLLAINCAGRMPPAETGLTCNSWYGKAHLEMHLWHMAWAPLWGHADLLERSFPWYHAHLPEARANAARNGFRGARWPKMVGNDALDSPSPVAVLLIWQQPHILVLLDLVRRAVLMDHPEKVPALLEKHWPLVQETADFMADFPVRDTYGIFHLEPPLIPVQERYAPEMTRDPAFEVAYWRFGLRIALRWAEDLGVTPPVIWREVCENMSLPPVHEGLYVAHAEASDSFENHLDDHPSMLQCLGFLPGWGVDPEIMDRTLATVLEKWDYSSLWGWDFAVLAMTALRLGKPELAVNQLLCDTPKNTYVISGHNRQETRNDLPLYLPGNGGLLLAAAMMAGGWEACGEKLPGFRSFPGWHAKAEDILPWY